MGKSPVVHSNTCAEAVFGLFLGRETSMVFDQTGLEPIEFQMNDEIDSSMSFHGFSMQESYTDDALVKRLETRFQRLIRILDR